MDVAMPIHILIEYSNNYSETSRTLWQYCRDEPAVNDNGAVVNFVAKNTTSYLKIKEK